MPSAVAIKVLIVDDQNSVRQMTRMTLEELGFRVIHEAENGVQAMETASIQPLDLTTARGQYAAGWAGASPRRMAAGGGCSMESRQFLFR